MELPRRPRKRLPGWILFALAAGVSAVAARALPVGAWLSSLENRAARMGPAGMAVYALVYVAAALLFVPGSLLTVGAGLTFGLARGMAVAWIAATTAAAIAFLIARHAARSRVAAFADDHRRFRAVARAVAAGGGKVVFLLRLSPLVPFSASNYLFGLTPIRFGPYLAATAAGMLPGALLYAALGAAGSILGTKRARGGWEWALLVAGLAATVAVSAILARAARRELRKGGLDGGE